MALCIASAKTKSRFANKLVTIPGAPCLPHLPVRCKKSIGFNGKSNKTT